jgi:hypothetical protein
MKIFAFSIQKLSARINQKAEHMHYMSNVNPQPPKFHVPRMCKYWVGYKCKSGQNNKMISIWLSRNILWHIICFIFTYLMIAFSNNFVILQFLLKIFRCYNSDNLLVNFDFFVIKQFCGQQSFMSDCKFYCLADVLFLSSLRSVHDLFPIQLRIEQRTVT